MFEFVGYLYDHKNFSRGYLGERREKMKLLVLMLLCFSLVRAEGTKKNKLPSISYTNILNCYPELKNPKMEFDVDLGDLKKVIDNKYPALRSTMRYRKVIFEDYKVAEDGGGNDNSATNKGSQKKRLTLSLTHLKKGNPEYRMTLEVLSDNKLGEIVSLPKNHENNPSKELIKSYLINTKIEEDESYWVDTRPNNKELTYKQLNEQLTELDFSELSRSRQLKCDRRKGQSVLCLCLKK